MALDLSRLTGGVGFRVYGAPHDQSGAAVSVADLNGDGIRDLVIGAPTTSPHGVGWAGETFVIYGGTDGWPDALDLGALPAGRGFRADGVDWYDRSGTWVANAGDLNGDGIGDLAIGGPATDEHGARVYVLFGSTDGFGDVFDLAALDGDNGFRIYGIGQLYGGQTPISGGRDLNGDGFDDLIIGAPNAGVEGRGRTYVVFGASGGIPAHLNLADLDGDGFWLDGVNDEDSSGYALAIAGDLNGDGLDDLAIGALGGARSGRAYVVFGSALGFADIDLAKLDGSDGFRIDGAHRGQRIGETVAEAGDVNGDGIEHLLVTGEGDAVYVVFGSAEGFDPYLKLAELDGTNGFRLTGGTDEAYSGWSAAAGDVNADGFGDLILGPSDSGWRHPQMTYLVYGHAGDFAPTLDLAALDGAQGLLFEGSDAASVSAGDLNGDGFDEIIVGTTYSWTYGVYDGVGRTDVIFGTTYLGGANDAPSARDDSVVAGSGSVVDLTEDHGAGFDTDPDFSDLTITAINGSPLRQGDGAVLASGLRVTLTGDTEVRFDRSALPFGATLAEDFNYRIADGRGGCDVASVSVRFFENDVRNVDGVGGFRIDWSHGGDRSGYSIASAGDVNGDGVDDLILGSPLADPHGRHDAGSSFVIYGHAMEAVDNCPGVPDALL